MKNLKLATLSVLASAFFFVSCEKKVVVDNSTANKTETPVTQDSQPNVAANNAEQDLPENVRMFLNKYYPNISIAKYEVKTKMNGKEYEIKLDNGVEVEFDNEENWKEIKDYNGVPEVLIPAKVNSYVMQNYKGIKIKSLERNVAKNKMDVDLLNGVDLDFDMDGIFLKIDR